MNKQNYRKFFVLCVNILTIISIYACGPSREPQAVDVLNDYLDCYNTNDIDRFNELSYGKKQIDNLYEISCLKPLVIEELNGVYLQSAEKEFEKYGIGKHKIKVFRVKFEVEYEKEIVDTNGIKEWLFFLFYNEEDNWIIYNKGIG
jgi:hypothetical protein